MGIPFIGPIIDGLKSVFGLIDNLHTSDEERLNAKANLMAIYQPILLASVDLEKAQVQLQAKLTEVEAGSGHFLQWSWRPITMYTMLIICTAPYVMTTFGYPTPPDWMVEKAWQALYYGLGFIGGTRGLEKVVKVLKSKEVI